MNFNRFRHMYDNLPTGSLPEQWGALTIMDFM
jgi:hypothetical protein